MAAALRGGSPAHGPHRAVTMATAALPAGPRGRRGEGAGPAPGRDIPASRRLPAALPPPSRSPSLRGSAEGRPSLPAPPPAVPGRRSPPAAAASGGKAAARPTSLQATSPVRRSRRPVLRREQAAVWLGECCWPGARRRWDKGGGCWLTLRAGTGTPFPGSPGALRAPRRLRGKRGRDSRARCSRMAPSPPAGPPLLLSGCVRAKGSCPRVWRGGEKPPLPKKPLMWF